MEAAKANLEAFKLTAKISMEKQKAAAEVSLDKATVAAETRAAVSAARAEAGVLTIISTAEQKALADHVNGQEFKQEIGDLAKGKVRAHLARLKREKLGN